MTVLLTSDTGWIISHQKFFENIKISEPLSFFSPISDSADVKKSHNEKTPVYIALNPNLFEITEPFRDKIKGKPVKTLTNIPLCSTAKHVKALADTILRDPQAKQIFNAEQFSEKINESEECHAGEDSKKLIDEESSESISWPKNNLVAVRTCQQFFEKVKHLEFPSFHGENRIQDSAVLSTVPGTFETKGCRYIFPADTKFYCNDVANMEKVFLENDEAAFDLIVMDPPWWNKFIRRRKRRQHEAGYEMIDDDGIAKLPINKILNENGIVCVWCTNAKSHQDKLINEIFPRWGVRHRETVYWLKVTKLGVPICPFNVENKKQPYETIIIGRKESHLATLKTSSYCANSTINDSKVIISVPSSINSHKPPIINVLKQIYMDQEFNRKLEIFARYLTPGFISYGNEVTKLQHESLYTSFPESKFRIGNGKLVDS